MLVAATGADGRPVVDGDDRPTAAKLRLSRPRLEFACGRASRASVGAVSGTRPLPRCTAAGAVAAAPSAGTTPSRGASKPAVDDRSERFRELFDACYLRLQAYARRRCEAADADDLVAEVLMVAWRRLDDIPRDAELPWLCGVARRVLANQRRSEHRRLRLVDRVGREPALVGSTSATEIDESAPGAVSALARLRPADQEVLLLAGWEELAPREIAVVLGCSANAAALRLSRARRRFRAALTEMTPSRTGSDRTDHHG